MQKRRLQISTNFTNKFYFVDKRKKIMFSTKKGNRRLSKIVIIDHESNMLNKNKNEFVDC